MASRRELVVAIVSDASQFNRGFDQAKRDVEGYGKTVDSVSKNQVSRFSQGITGLRTSLGGLAAGFAAFASVSFLKSALEEAEHANEVFATTQQVIESTGGAAGVSADYVKDLADEMALLTGIDDEIILEGENVLLTFKNLKNELGEGNDVFDRAAGLMLDISAVMGTDAKSAALQLGKALNDPVSQMGALSRAGLTFTQDQKEQIKNLAQSGDLLKAQTIILDELETQLGGTAEASATATDKMAVAFDQIVESIGQAVLEPLEDALPTILDIINRIGDGLGILAANDIFGKIAAQTGAAAGGSKNLAIAIAQASDEMKRLGDEAGGTGSKGITAISDLFSGIIDESGAGVDALVELRDSLGVLVDQEFITATQSEVLAEVIGEKLVTAGYEARDAARHAGKAQQEQGIAAEGAAEGVEEFAEANTTAGDKARFAAEKASDAAAAVRDLRSAFLEAADPAFAAAEAVDRMRDAEQNLKDVREDSESTRRDVIQAQLDYAEATLDAQAALDEFTAEDAVSAISTLATTLGISRDKAEELLEQLGLLDGTVVDITIATHGTATGGGAGGLLEGFAAGGPVSAGVPVMVGEQGSEIFVPQSAGRILPHSQVGAVGGTFAPQIIVQGDVSDRNLQQIQTELILTSVGRWAENH